MSRDYGRLHTAYWNNPAIRGCSDIGKLLGAYLLTGPHSNSIGAYLLPDAYIADDLGWDRAAVTAALKELSAAGFSERFADGRHIVICKFLVWNPIENPNVGKAALRQLEQLPNDPAIQHVLDGLKGCEKQFPNGLETVLEQFRTTKPSTKPETNHEPEHDTARSAVADALASQPVVEIVETKVSREPQQGDLLSAPVPIASAEIVPLDPLERAKDAYNLAAERVHWPICEVLTDPRKKSLRKRLTECGGFEGWCTALTKGVQSKFLRGENDRGWRPGGIDFFLQAKSFTKLMEGAYDDVTGNAERGADALDAGFARAAAAYGD